MRKVIEKNGGALIEERLYLGGFESSAAAMHPGRSRSNAKRCSHGRPRRIALVETRTQGNEPVCRRSLSVISSAITSARPAWSWTTQAQIISYEEYYPYGSTSYQAGRSQTEVSLKRYRYTGKERDEETGFNYHGARYYAPWLGRWVAGDPVGIMEGLNLYEYVEGNPIERSDISRDAARP